MFEDEYKDSKSSRQEYCCRVCDGPVEPIQLVCNECHRRDTEEMKREQELYSALLWSEEPVYREPEKETVAANTSSGKEGPGAKRKSYEM